MTAGEQLFVNVGASQVGGRVLGVKGDLAKIALTAPACAQAKDKVALSRRIDKHWRLVGKYTHRDELRSYIGLDLISFSLLLHVLQDGERSYAVPLQRSRKIRRHDNFSLPILYKLHLYRLPILSLDIMATSRPDRTGT